jgi:hypothetical protein
MVVGSVMNYLDKLNQVINVARKIKTARDERHKRISEIQNIAAKARKTGIAQTEALREFDKTPAVWDLGDLVEELCEALDKLDCH